MYNVFEVTEATIIWNKFDHKKSITYQTSAKETDKNFGKRGIIVSSFSTANECTGLI